VYVTVDISKKRVIAQCSVTRDNNEGYEITGAKIPGFRSRGGLNIYGVA